MAAQAAGARPVVMDNVQMYGRAHGRPFTDDRAADAHTRKGCVLRDDGSIAIDSDQATTIDCVYAAGNCSEPRALVPVATGSGATAAVAINARLSLEDADSAVARPSTARHSH